MEVQGGADRISVSDRGGWGYDDEDGGRAILFAMPDIGVRCASLLCCPMSSPAFLAEEGTETTDGNPILGGVHSLA
ncbi:hypothetical protein N7481_004394 [Penicillium waksmanii]|uniref:uncharacterized protein n=1 Tax=Penicillium waksmanii TaxID=69791 RepID=UPI002546FDE4|nr:uncharacterized protein N7481_004394 [Penicillium waksmanii]KAJ5989184.1 hypothetical protein N7481_004394 [Penicillium waksmanii]